MQDTWHKRVSNLPLDNQANFVGKILEDGYQQLQEHLQTLSSSMQYLEAVAGVRYALSILAKQLKKDDIKSATMLRIAKDLCMDTRLNIIDPSGRVDTTGPVLYLVKLLVRQFGLDCLKNVSQAYPWVIPESLRRADNVSVHTIIF